MASTHNGRGYLRSGRSPPFLVVSLLVVISILAYNYWNSASANSELRNSVSDLEDRLRLYNLKKTSLENRNDALIQRVRETDRQLEDSKAKFTNKDSELGTIKQQLVDTQEQLESLRQEKGTVEAEASGARKELDSLQARFQELQGQHNALAEEMQQQQQDNDRKVQEKLEYTSMQCKQQLEAANEECDGKLRDVAGRYAQLQAMYNAAQKQAPQSAGQLAAGGAVPNQDQQEAQLHNRVVQMNQVNQQNLAANISLVPPATHRDQWEYPQENMSAPLLLSEHRNATLDTTQMEWRGNTSAAQEQPIIAGLTWSTDARNQSELYNVQNVTGETEKHQAVHGVQQQLADQQELQGGAAAPAEGQEGVVNVQPPGAGETEQGQEGDAAEAGEEGQQEGGDEQVDDDDDDYAVDEEDEDEDGDVDRAEDYVYGDGEEEGDQPQDEAKDTMFQEGGDAGERAEEGGPAEEQGEHLEGGHAAEEGVLGEHVGDELVQEEHLEGGHAGEDNGEELHHGGRGDGDNVEYNEDDEGADEDHIGNNEIPDDEQAADEQNQQIIKEENEGAQEYYHDNQIVPQVADADRDLDMQGGDGDGDEGDEGEEDGDDIDGGEDEDDDDNDNDEEEEEDDEEPEDQEKGDVQMHADAGMPGVEEGVQVAAPM
ncbi:protein GOLM2-like isoform X1 [Branchiostoma lanceolatum]|uniref:protein GOLM2-like isoform X1 n=1 Tax=Branchiostoma lanceolatum TaxID=7740 RepID=UPI003455C201